MILECWSRCSYILLSFSQPKGPRLLQLRHQVAADVRRQDLVQASQQLAAHEDGGHRRSSVGGATAGPIVVFPIVVLLCWWWWWWLFQEAKRLLHVSAVGVVVELMHRGADAQTAQQPLHHMAHAAAALAEHHHRILLHQLLHLLPRKRHPLLLSHIGFLHFFHATTTTVPTTVAAVAVVVVVHAPSLDPPPRCELAVCKQNHLPIERLQIINNLLNGNNYTICFGNP